MADYETKLVQKFDAAGTFITSWKLGEDVGISGTPEGIAVGADQNLYITDYDYGRIQVFTQDGEFLWAIGDKSPSANPFKRPTAIAFDADGQLYVVNQSTGKVSVIIPPEK